MKLLHAVRSIQTKRAKLSFGSGMAVLALAVQSAAAVVPANTYTTWVAPARGYTQMSWTVKPETDPSPQSYFWSHQWFIDNGGGSDTPAYAGLQTVGSGFGGKIAIFSIWDAVAGFSGTPGSQCVVFGGEGTGYSCRIPYDWQVGRTYAFNLNRIQPSVWEVTVTDQTAQTTASIGQITVPATWGALADQSIAFTEYYGPSLATCPAANYARARFGSPAYQNGTVNPTYNVSQLQTNSCQANSKVSNTDGGTVHEVSPAYGLNGAYYKDTALGQLGLSRTDQDINFAWQKRSPATALPKDNFSVRWTGTFQAAQTALHTFCAQYNDGARLWVNGVQLVNDFTAHNSDTERCGTVQLTMGQFYSLKMEFVDYTNNATAKLLYSTIATPKQVVPAAMFRTK